jgi:hypothetical protein
LRDPERMARFQREAEVLALDYPNVGPICAGIVKLIWLIPGQESER